MHVLALGRCILDRARKKEEFMCRCAERGLMEDDGVAVIGIAGLLPGRQVLGDEGSEFGLRERLGGIRGKDLGHEKQ